MSPDIIMWLVGGLVTVLLIIIGYLATDYVKQLRVRITANEAGLVKTNDALSGVQDTLEEKIAASHDALVSYMEQNKQEILVVISGMQDKSVPQTSCDAKQELWGVRFDNMMAKIDSYIAQDTKEHGLIIDAMDRGAVTNLQQMVDIIERLDAVSECLHKLQLNKNC